MGTIASMLGFVAVAKAGSFSAAAQKLDLVSSVVTKGVTQLGRIAGKSLSHRSTRKKRLHRTFVENVVALCHPADDQQP